MPESWRRDTEGHGTFVAGILAASPFNDVGIAGIGFNVQLLIGKVVEPDGVSPEAEARAITWAVDKGAQVINLSLGGQRDPDDEALDTFSPPERDAIAYATSKGVVVVSAVGNGDEAPAKPWRFADWPSALPHVIGVGALRPDGSVPAFSNRDPLFVDLAAPGDGHLLDDPAEPDRPDARRLHASRTRSAGPCSTATRSGPRSRRRRCRPPPRSCSASTRR